MAPLDSAPLDIAHEDSSTDPDASAEVDASGWLEPCDQPPFGPWCACTADAECLSGQCVPTRFGGICPLINSCMDQCPEGWRCDLLPLGDDMMPTCLHKAVALCSPCVTDAECTALTRRGRVEPMDNRCLDYGALGQFCGAECSTWMECPPGFDCATGEDGVGQCWVHTSYDAGGSTSCSRTSPCPAGEMCVEQRGDAIGHCRVLTPSACPPKAAADVLVVPNRRREEPAKRP